MRRFLDRLAWAIVGLAFGAFIAGIFASAIAENGVWVTLGIFAAICTVGWAVWRVVDVDIG